MNVFKVGQFWTSIYKDVLWLIVGVEGNQKYFQVVWSVHGSVGDIYKYSAPLAGSDFLKLASDDPEFADKISQIDANLLIADAHLTNFEGRTWGTR
jgi:uncharacterized protein (DUF736 family)